MSFITGNSSDNSLNGGSGEDTIWGLGGDDTLYGLGGDDTLLGFSGDDFLAGGTGWDTLIGGTGNDLYDVDSLADVVLEDANGGYDLVYANVTHSLSANVEALVLYNLAGINGFGNVLDNNIIGGNYDNYLGGGAGNDLLQGKGGNDVLDGGAGNDWLVGGSGNDTFYFDSSGDHLTEDNILGTDLIKSYISHSMQYDDNVENMELLGSTSINGFGNDLNNTIWGNSGNNILDGDDGIDRLIGGAGNDTYYVRQVGDIVEESANAGTDRVFAYANHTLASNVENLTLFDAAIFGAGNTLDNQINGNALNNTLNGGNGADTLNGDIGADTMTGGAGGDTYYVDNPGDVVIETDGGGGDWVQTKLNGYMLGANLENLELAESGLPVTGTGNELDNQILGNPGGNVLNGLGGNDTLDGVYGGNDTIAGTGPSDTFVGGTGDDTFYLHTLGDVVTELAGEGHDSAYIDISGYTLAGEVEDLFLVEDGDALTATGNGMDNLVTGNSFANTLDGGLGGDTVAGLGGNDTIIGSAGQDDILGGAGTDTMNWGGWGLGRVVVNLIDGVMDVGGAGVLQTIGTVENVIGTGLNDIMLGSAAGNRFDGGAGDDEMLGYNGNDTFLGGAGVDTLTGGANDDRFELNSLSATDIITDFTAGNGSGDTLALLGLGVSTFAQVQALMQQAGANVQIDFGGGTLLVLNNTTVASFNAGDVTFA